MQRNVKLYGPLHALDTDNVSSCWNSDGSKDSKQFFLLDFGRSVYIQKLRIQFQAGFAANSCQVLVKTEHSWDVVAQWEPEDSHDLQTLEIEHENRVTAMKLAFENLTDFYGRVTIYRMEVWGKEAT